MIRRKVALETMRMSERRRARRTPAVVSNRVTSLAIKTLGRALLSALFGVTLPAVTQAAPSPAPTMVEHGVTASPIAAPRDDWKWPGQVTDESVKKALVRPTVAALMSEMERAMRGLQLPQRQPPYFLAYTLLDVEQRLVVGQLGSVIQSQRQVGRTLRPEVRVGSMTLDNSFAVSEGGVPGVEAFGQELVLDDDPTALRTSIWLATDAAYRAATAALEQKSAQRASERELEARPFDFAPEKPTQLVSTESAALPDLAQLEQLVSTVSKEFLAFPEVDESVVTAAAWRIERTLLTSEGTLVITPTQVVEVTIECNTQADDGMPLSHQITLFGAQNPAELRDAARRMATELTELRRAPLAPDYYGPVLFSGVSAPQILQELLANTVVGTPVPNEGAWARRLQRRVLPDSVNLVDDPTLHQLGDVKLLGAYEADDEGTPAQRVSLVERGRLETLLMSRTPSRDIGNSNGHGRTGYASWTRGAVGNLILSTREPTPLATQRRQLMKSAPIAGQPALEIERLGPREFATNGGAPPAVERAFLISPEGKRTLVRGVTLSEMQVRDLKDVVSVGNEPVVYGVLQNAGGFSVPTAFVSPSLLFEEIEIKRIKESPALPKFLPKSGTTTRAADGPRASVATRVVDVTRGTEVGAVCLRR